MADKKYYYKMKSKEPTPLNSEEDVWNVLQLAGEIYSFQNQVISRFPYGAYSPQLTNALMQNINMNPVEGTASEITKALKDPKSNEQSLIGYTEWTELNSMLFKRIMGYFANLLAFDLTYICTNIDDDKRGYNAPAYKKDLNKVQEFLDKFKYKNEFKTIMKEILRTEAYFGILRQEGNRYIIQELPQKYCEITGRYDYGLLFDFDYYWLIQGGIDVDMYPHVMKKTLNDLMKNEPDAQYQPSSKLNTRTGSFALWHQTSPKDGFVAFKFSPELATRVPLLSPLLPNIVLEPVIRELQKNSYIAEATKIIYGEVPLLKETAQKLKDNIAITPKNLGRFLALIQSALPDAIKVAAAPLNNTVPISFEGNNEIFDSYLKTSAASAGINSRLLYSTDRQNVQETKASLDVDQNMLRLVYSQFEDFLEYHINRNTAKYKFKFIFEGFETDIDRERRFKNITNLGEQGIVLDQKYAAAIGMNPFDFRRMLAETKASGFVKNLTPIMKSSQMSSKNNDGGRPEKSEGDLTDSGSDTRSAGSNEEKTG